MSEKKVSKQGSKPKNFNAGKSKVHNSVASRFIDKITTPMLEHVWMDINSYIKYYIDLPVVPDICTPGFPVTLEQAEQTFASVDLKLLPISMSIYEADSKFRNHRDGQVVAVNHKPGKKAKRGKYIQVKYITQEVINESIRLYEKEESDSKKIADAIKLKAEQDENAAKQKQEDKLKAKEQAEAAKAEQMKQREIAKHDRKEIRVAKRNEQINSIKKVSSEVANNLQSTVKKVPTVFKIKPKGDEKA